MAARSVEIRRDRWGIPHIRGASATDVAYGQGLAAAQDRAWQLTYDGWRAQGRVAEHVGNAGVDWDVFARRTRIAATAERGLRLLDEETRAFVTAYVDGVNAGLAEAEAPEFEHLGLEPEPWPSWMPLGVFLAQHILFSTFATKLWRARLVDRLGVEALSWLRLDAAPAPAIVGGELSLPPAPDRDALESVAEALGEDWLHAEPDSTGLNGLDGLGGGPMLSGSNCFAVGGSRTQTGRPLIAGDPHRLHDLPNVYHQVHLVGPDFDVLGLAFVGVPGIPHFAHAGSVAWGITNAMADYQDLYVEELQRGGVGVSSRTSTGWAPVEVSRDVVLVRDGEPITVELLATRHGPVVLPLSTDRVVSLRCPSLVDADLGFAALLPLLRSRTAADVESAFGRWVEPVNNVVVADAEGVVRYRTAGAVPHRHPANQWLPVPGWDDAYAWRGLLADEELPRWSVPPDGQLVTANQRIAGFDRSVTVEAGDSSRAQRIGDLLRGRTGLDVDDLARIQADSGLDVSGWREALAGMDDLGPAESAQAREVASFDGRMEADSVPAMTFAALRSALVTGLADDPVFAELLQHRDLPGFWDRWMSVAVRVEAGLEHLLAHARERPLGLDIERALRTALREVARESPTSPWGRAHGYRPTHALVALGVDGADRFDPGRTVGHVPLAGDSRSVQANHSVPGISDLSVMGPVARYVWDLSDRSRSRWVVPLGASGVPGHPHFDDQLEAWAAGGSLPVITELL